MEQARGRKIDRFYPICLQQAVERAPNQLVERRAVGWSGVEQFAAASGRIEIGSLPGVAPRFVYQGGELFLLVKEEFSL